LGVTWIAIPSIAAVSISLSSKQIQEENRAILGRLGNEYRVLCDSPDREVIRRTVDGVQEVAVTPGRGPTDQWGNDLFFPSRGGGPDVSAGWIAGPKGGRYGGYKRVVALSSLTDTSAVPRYHVSFRHLTAGLIDERSTIHGVDIRIVDSVANEVIAERRDYMETLSDEFVFPKGCAGREREDRGKWQRDHLEFIRKVLIPVPGVRIVQKDLLLVREGRERHIVKPEDFSSSVAARVVDEWPPTSRFDHIEKHLPPGFEYGYSRRKDSVGEFLERAIVLLKPDKDIKIGQGLGGDYNTNLLAVELEGDGFTAVFATGFRSDVDQPFLVLRRFGGEGDLLGQTHVALPATISPRTYIHSPDHKLQITKTEYRLRISPRQEKVLTGVDLELSIPRSALKSSSRKESQ